MISMFAIANCDTVKKARRFLDENNIAYEFVDFKKTPPTQARLKAWSDFFGELPINKQGMTYRKHKEHYEALTMPEKLNFIRANTSLIKRPVLEKDGKIISIGFKEEQYRELLGV